MAVSFSSLADRWWELGTPLLPITLLLLSVLYLVWGRYRTRKSEQRTTTAMTTPAVTSRAGEGVEAPFAIGKVRVSKISVYPIKSCRGTSVSEVRYHSEGIENDRKWCVIDAKTHAILTARQVPNMVLITPRIQPDASSPYGGRLVVSFPENSGCDDFAVPLNPTKNMLHKWDIIQDGIINGKWKVDGYVCQSVSSTPDAPSTTLSKYFGRPVHLMTKGPTPRKCPPTWAFPDLQNTAALQDGYPLHVASEESLVEFQKAVKEMARKGEAAAIGGLDHARWSKDAVDMERFRPNIVFKGAGVPFAEDFWREVLIGNTSPPITLVAKCARCLLPNVDTERGTRDAAVPYKILMKTRTGKDLLDLSKPCFGCNGVFGGEGVVRVGDFVTVKKWADANGV